jgi:hypothetical protein
MVRLVGIVGLENSAALHSRPLEWLRLRQSHAPETSWPCLGRPDALAVAGQQDFDLHRGATLIELRDREKVVVKEDRASTTTFSVLT